MTVIRAQVVFPFFTNLPTDVSTNTLWFDGPGDLEDAVALLRDPVGEFFTTIYGSTAASYINWTQASVRWYDMGQPTPRVPIVDPLQWDPSPSTAVNTVVPTEVAIVMSFQGDLVPGQPQARRRGRIYIGGLVESDLLASLADQFPRIAAATITQCNNAAAALRTASASASHPWVVRSQTQNTSAVVTNGWCDNSPDTQRRRSVDAQSRTTWS